MKGTDTEISGIRIPTTAGKGIGFDRFDVGNMDVLYAIAVGKGILIDGLEVFGFREFDFLKGFIGKGEFADAAERRGQDDLTGSLHFRGGTGIAPADDAAPFDDGLGFPRLTVHTKEDEVGVGIVTDIDATIFLVGGKHRIGAVFQLSGKGLDAIVDDELLEWGVNIMRMEFRQRGRQRDLLQKRVVELEGHIDGLDGLSLERGGKGQFLGRADEADDAVTVSIGLIKETILIMTHAVDGACASVLKGYHARISRFRA